MKFKILTFAIFLLFISALKIVADTTFSGVTMTGIQVNPDQFLNNAGAVIVYDPVFGVQTASTNAIGLRDLSYNGNDISMNPTNAPYYSPSATTNNVPCVYFTQQQIANGNYTNIGIASYLTGKKTWTIVTLVSAHTNAASVIWQANWSAGTNGNASRIECSPCGATLNQTQLRMGSNTNQAMLTAFATGGTTDQWFYTVSRFDGTVGDSWYNTNKGTTTISVPANLTVDRFLMGVGQNSGATTFNMRWNGFLKLFALFPTNLTDQQVITVVTNCNTRIMTTF